MIAARYLVLLAAVAALWCGVFLGFIALVDPYGVSPMRMGISGVNGFKPSRVDIDRILKPYEVWRYQPKTVFLSSSRIHQGLDPAALNGTTLAPAYNASIPASTLSENAAHLEQFFKLDPNLKVVFVELFFSNFVFPNHEAPRLMMVSFALNALALHMSATAFLDAARTVLINRTGHYAGPRVTARGNWLPQTAPYAQGTFNGYVDGKMAGHKSLVDLRLQPSVFAALDRIVSACRARGATLYLLIAPHHPYDDYRWLSLGYWPLLEEWYRMVAEYPGVVSFAQYNGPLKEPIKERMEYWYDPIHFSLKMGNLVLRSFLGPRKPDIPDNMLVSVVPTSAGRAIADGRAGLEGWMRENPAFVAKFEAAKIATGNDEATRLWTRDNLEAAASRAAAARERALARSRVDHVAETLAALASLQATLIQRYPAATVTGYRNVTAELAIAQVLPSDMLQRGKVENAWGGAFHAQIFPAGAWRAGAAATYNYVFEAVPRADCSRLMASLSQRNSPKPLRINLEPSGRIHESFPISSADGCAEGLNTIGYTVMAE